MPRLEAHDERLTIKGLTARAVRTPLERKVRTASGAIEESLLVLLDVLTDEGVTGYVCLFGYTPMTLKSLVCLIEQLAPELVGKRVVPLERLRQLQDRYRLLGSQGLLGMVASGLDIAYWDTLGRAADAPVVSLLGGEPRSLRAYDSYGMVDPLKDEKALRTSLDQGFKAIKIKVGYPDAKQDVDVVRAVRDMIGPDVALMVDYNQPHARRSDSAYRAHRAVRSDMGGRTRSRRGFAGHGADAAGGERRDPDGRELVVPRDAERALSAGACDMMMLDVMKIGGHHRMARHDGHGADAFHADVEPYLRRSQRARARRFADLSLPRISRFRGRDSRGSGTSSSMDVSRREGRGAASNGTKRR
ncbi:mandelate racemase/muconate lactonizing enzyme [Candidatus Paraburkholderia calva]|nr:mandelate racemase/muconate lactonizing enzyme [Candidatus Paraburkholderia calva]